MIYLQNHGGENPGDSPGQHLREDDGFLVGKCDKPLFVNPLVCLLLRLCESN